MTQELQQNQEQVIELDLKVKLDMNTKEAKITHSELSITDAESKSKSILRYYENRVKFIRDRIQAFSSNTFVSDESVKRQYEQKRFELEIQLSTVLDDYEQVKMIYGLI
jgi:galactokinase